MTNISWKRMFARSKRACSASVMSKAVSIRENECGFLSYSLMKYRKNCNCSLLGRRVNENTPALLIHSMALFALFACDVVWLGHLR